MRSRENKLKSQKLLKINEKINEDKGKRKKNTRRNSVKEYEQNWLNEQRK